MGVADVDVNKKKYIRKSESGNNNNLNSIIITIMISIIKKGKLWLL